MSNFGMRLQIEKPIAKWYGSSLITKLIATLLTDELISCGFKLDRVSETEVGIIINNVVTGVILIRTDRIALVLTCEEGCEANAWSLANRFVTIAHSGYN